ncbi:MAG: peptidylprolyl isomerase, partial [Polyangiales bacterium]
MKSPAVHFMLLGLGILVVSRLFLSDDMNEQPEGTRIVFSSQQIDGLIAKYEETTGIAATDEVKTELIDRAAEEEMLYRESHRWGLASNNPAVDRRLRQIMAFVAEEELGDEELVRQAQDLGLDASDAVIRGMLAQNMRLLLARDGERTPSDEEVLAYYEIDGARFASPPRMTGWQVFFSRERGQPTALVAARATKRDLDARPRNVDEAVELGDPTPSGARFRGQLAHQLASRFGQEFAAVAGGIPERQWSDPVESPFGVHLVFVDART